MKRAHLGGIGAHLSGQSLDDPDRADRKLRRFSWQEPVVKHAPPPPHLRIGPIQREEHL